MAEKFLGSVRDVVVSLAGSVKHKPPYFVFRERIFVSGAAQLPRFQNDTRILIQSFPGDEAQRHAFARDYASHRAELYARSEFCLVMPGDGNTAGRLFDVIVHGCVPVLLFHPDTYPVLPFPKHLPWAEFSIVHQIESEQDAASVFDRLLLLPPDVRLRFRRKVIAHASLVALALEACAADVQSALSLISAELHERTLWLTEHLLPLIQTAPSPTDAKYWLNWGPAYHPVRDLQ